MPSPEPYRDDDRPRRALPAWVDAEEAAQVVELARIEARAAGFDPEAAGDEALADYLQSERVRFGREVPASVRFTRGPDGSNGSLGWVEEARKVVGDSPPREQTPGQRRRFLRNQVILAASIAGFSQRTLGEVFDLPHSRIHAILEEMRRRTGRD